MSHSLVGRLAWRTLVEANNDDCLNMAAALSFYLFFALFPALPCLVALTSFLPLHVVDHMLTSLGRVAPQQVSTIVRQQAQKIAAGSNVGVLTAGFAGALWTSSTAAASAIETINRAFNVRQTRNWIEHRLLALVILMVLAIFGVVSFALVMAGPEMALRIAQGVGLGRAFSRAWAIGRWPVAFVLIAAAFAIVYRLAPDVRPRRVLPGAIFGTALWLGASEGFRLCVTRFASVNATYGAITGVIVVLMWLYLSSMALLVGAELNAAIEHSVDRHPTAAAGAANDA